MTPTELLPKVKDNLILSHGQDDELLLRLIAAAINYAESYQHVEAGSPRPRGYGTGGNYAGVQLVRVPRRLDSGLLRRQRSGKPAGLEYGQHAAKARPAMGGIASWLTGK